MAGHVQDRWWRQKKDDDGNLMFDGRGRPIRERSPLYGKGMRYKVRYYVGTVEKSESFPDKSLDRAKNFLAKVQTDILTGTYIDPDAGKVKFRAYTQQWRKGQSTDPSTVQTIDSRLNSMVWPFLGEKNLDEITTDTIRDWLAWMDGKGLRASYRAILFNLVSAILSGAIDDEKIRTNPCKAKSIKRPKVEDRKIIPWTAGKLHAIQLALPPRYQIVVPVGGGLALRQMEILGFSPDDIDRDSMVAHVQRQIRWVSGVAVFAPPKGGKTREVPLGAGVLASIDDHMATYPPASVTLPWLKPGGDPVTARLLIPKESGIWRGHGFNNQVWRPAVHAAGYTFTKRFDGMHAMRHFCASNCLANNVSIKEVSDFLGHHDPGYTLRTYTHLVPSSHERARAASDHIFTPKDAA